MPADEEDHGDALYAPTPRSCLPCLQIANASFAAVANTCNLPEINTAALKKFNADLEARAAATEAPTTAQTFEPTATPESDAAGRMSPAVGAAAVALLAFVA